MLAFDSFPKIDAHIHFNADRTNLLDMASEYNFSLLTINTEIPEFPSIKEQQQLAVASQESSNTDLFYATTVSTENVFEDNWAEKAIDKIQQDFNNKGASAVKFWKNIGMSIQREDGSFLMLDDPEFQLIFKFLENEQIPVLAHQGEPKNCWLPVNEMTVTSDREYFSAHPQYHMYKHDEYPGYWEHINARDHILEQHPKLNFVGLHLASLEWNLDEVAERLDKFPHMAVDLAERISHLYYHTVRDRNKVIDFFDKYQDRIIYGTDIINDPEQDADTINKDLEHRWNSHWQFLTTDKKLSSKQVSESFQGLDLPESIIKKIYRDNAVTWYQLGNS